MSSGFPMSKLAVALKQRSEFIEIDDFTTYKRCRVQLHTQGIVERDEVPGAEIKTKRQQVCRANEFLVAEIDAKVGGFGIVPTNLDGAIVSSHYFLFTVDENVLDRRFLDYYSRTHAFIDQVRAQGTTNYAAIRPSNVLNYEIPLPPLEEQRRIVARIEQLAAKIEEARGLRREAMKNMQSVIPQTLAFLLNNNELPTYILGDLLREPSQNGLSPRPSDNPPGIPILRISAATSRQDLTVDEQDFKYLELGEQEISKYKVKKGDLLACRFNGNIQFVGKFALYQGSSGQLQVYPDKLIRFRMDSAKVLPEFACLALNSPKAREIIENFCATTAGNIGISASNLKTIPISLPPLDEQRRIVAQLDALQARVDALRRMQAESSAELDALLPSILDKAFKGEL